MLLSSFGFKTKLNGQDQDLKKMVLRPLLRSRPVLRPSSRIAFIHHVWMSFFCFSPTGDYRQEVRFCENYALQLGMAVATPPTSTCPPSASNVAMRLYGGTNQTDRTIPLFNYFHNLKRASRLLRNNDDFKFPFYPANVRTLVPIYLPSKYAIIYRYLYQLGFGIMISCFLLS